MRDSEARTKIPKGTSQPLVGEGWLAGMDPRGADFIILGGGACLLDEASRTDFVVREVFVWASLEYLLGEYVFNVFGGFSSKSQIGYCCLEDFWPYQSACRDAPYVMFLFLGKCK